MKISFRFIISFAIILLFQMTMLKLLLIFYKSKCVSLYLIIEEGKLTHRNLKWTCYYSGLYV